MHGFHAPRHPAFFWPIDPSSGRFIQSRLTRLRISGFTQPTFTLEMSRFAPNAKNSRFAVVTP